MANTIQVKRGAFADLPALAAGEVGFSTDTFQLHVGNGGTNYEVVMHNLYDAQSVLAATADNTPVALTVDTQTVVGRITAGNVAALTGANLWTILAGASAADVSMNSHKLTSVTDPTGAQDAATKAYVDALVQGLKIHDAVACATTANITLEDEQTLDGILTSTDRVLVKNQTAPEENGIYVSAVGAWARAADMDASDEVPQSFVFVSDGTTLGSTGWACTVDPDGFVLDTTAMPWAQFSSTGYVTASGGLLKTGNDIASTGVLEDLVALTAPASDGQFIVATGAGAFQYELPAVVMATLSGGATASFSMNSQLITSVLDPVSDQDAATKKWVTDNFTAGTAATPALDNLASVAINAALVPGTAGALDFGSTTKPWADMWFAGTSGTPGTNQFKITGVSTDGVRTITAPDKSGYMLLTAAANILDGGAFA